jgi:hypothetical protein
MHHRLCRRHYPFARGLKLWDSCHTNRQPCRRQYPFGFGSKLWDNYRKHYLLNRRHDPLGLGSELKDNYHKHYLLSRRHDPLGLGSELKDNYHKHYLQCHRRHPLGLGSKPWDNCHYSLREPENTVNEKLSTTKQQAKQCLPKTPLPSVSTPLTVTFAEQLALRLPSVHVNVTKVVPTGYGPAGLWVHVRTVPSGSEEMLSMDAFAGLHWLREVTVTSLHWATGA